MRLSCLVCGRRSLGYVAGCPRQRGVIRLVSRRRRLWRGPDPLAVGPEPEHGAEPDADVVRHDVRELAGLAQAVVGNADHCPLDQQPDSVEREEHHGLTGDGGALAVPEAPVPVGHVAGHRGDDDRDGGRRQRPAVEAEMQPAVDEVVDDHADAADDAELGALMDQQPETLVEPSHTAHQGGPPFDRRHQAVLPRTARRQCTAGKITRAGTSPVPRARIPGFMRRPGLLLAVIRSALSAPPGRVADVANPDILIRARGLTKTFGEFTAVDGIDFELSRGEVFGFLGPNGAGKSSTMRMIGCVSPPSGGELTILGMDPVRERTAQLLEFVQLTERARDQVEPLSGGMKRRLTIARSLISEPEILLLDEPTTGLDPQARHVVWDRLYRLKQQGVTLVLTTHYMDEAEQLCDRLVIMDGGRIVAEGAPRALVAEHATR